MNDEPESAASVGSGERVDDMRRCPFCGSDDLEECEKMFCTDNGEFDAICCCNCEMAGPPAFTGTATEAWNRRITTFHPVMPPRPDRGYAAPAVDYRKAQQEHSAWLWMTINLPRLLSLHRDDRGRPLYDSAKHAADHFALLAAQAPKDGHE